MIENSDYESLRDLLVNPEKVEIVFVVPPWHHGIFQQQFGRAGYAIKPH